MLVTPKRSVNNNNSNLSGSRCNAVTAWVEVSNTLQDNWAHSLPRRGLNAVYFLWFVIKRLFLIYLFFVSYLFIYFFVWFLESRNRPVVITSPSINQSKHKSYEKFFRTSFCIFRESLYLSGLAKGRNARYNFPLLFSIHLQLKHRCV